MTIVVSVLAVVFLLCIPAAYFFGRRSAVERALDVRWGRGTRLPVINDQAAADQGRPPMSDPSFVDSTAGRDMGDRLSYAEFLARRAQLDGDHGFAPVWMPE